MLRIVGFDRYINLSWLDTMAYLLLNSTQKNYTLKNIRSYSHEMLKEAYPSHESRRKTITVLTRIWIRVPDNHKSLQQQAIKLYDNVSPHERIWIHWGMCLIAYPLFRDISSIIGKLLLIQKEVKTSQIHQRIKEKWGQRTTLIRAINRVIQSMDSWKVISLEKEKVIRSTLKYNSDNMDLQMWLIQAVLISEFQESMQLQRLMKSPSLFPFDIDISRYDLQRDSHFIYCKENVNSEILSLRR